MNYLKNWISDRIDWLDSQMDKIEPSFAVSSEKTSLDYNQSMVYPNPFSDKFTIEIDLHNHAIVDIKIVNLLGQQVCNKTVTAEPGRHTIDFTYNELGQKGNVFLYKILTEGQLLKSGKILHK